MMPSKLGVLLKFPIIPHLPCINILLFSFFILLYHSSLNLNSVQSTLRSLLKKNYIEVSDIVYSGKVLTRSYIPVVSSEDYASENINGVVKDLLSSNILFQYVESENDIEVIERLQKKLEERKKALERKS